MKSICSACALLAVVMVSTLSGCESTDERRSKHDAALRADPAGPQPGARRCGDFLSEKEAKELGVEEYRASKGDTNPLRGVVCTMYPVVLTVFMAEQYGTMLKGAKSLKGLKELEGPKLGKESFWFEANENRQVMFVSDSGKYAFGVSGEDQALVEKAARLVSKDR